ncbi:uncharacterized protein [Venturia canescens]|nr:uncharacterized protein LOC122409712 isoform X2 [Venturia canescens]XP_043273399.1 uncharacterized protein LOC122409712 isoform X2 [Venturia canescens]XP_043282688.1 uncharacterized protein LOC122415004 [Venturia canescens]XP_043282689.1 uncharacterized protein LOC122415004 [Venturia canescens]
MEYLGNTRFFHETYNVISYYNLDELTWEESEITKGLNFVENLCSQNCTEKRLIQRLREQLNIIRNDKYTLFSTIGVPTLYRNKRGLFDFVGKISKILFGTMSADDAEYYNKEIDAVHNDNKRIGELFRNQTHIIQLFLQKSEGLFRKYNDTFNKINLNFQNLGNELNELIKRDEVLAKDSLLTEMCLEIELALIGLDRNVRILIESIMFAKTGQTNPQLLSPELLMSAIKLIKEEKGSDQMPIPVHDGNYFEYLEVSDVAISVIGYRFVYVTKIPILEVENYKAFRVIPAPKLIGNNLIAYISNPHDYIITNDEKLLYTPSDERFLDTCKVHQFRYFCKRINPKYYMKAHDTCLSKIVNEPLKLNKNDCTIKIVHVTHTMWVQFKSNNKWLYTAPKPESIRIMCKENVEEKMINGTKILWIEPGCSAVTNDAILNSHIEKEYEQNKAFTPLITYNFSDHFQVLEKSFFNLSLVRIHTIETPDVKTGDLTKYGTKLSDLSKEIDEIGSHQRTKSFQENLITWFWYILYGVATVLIIYLTFKLRIVKILKCLLNKVSNLCTSLSNYFLDQQTERNAFRNDIFMESIPEVNSVSSLETLPNRPVKIKHSSQTTRGNLRHSNLRISEFCDHN